MDRHRKCYLIPPGEDPCVWMTAGVLLYQLCGREFRCEECPLDSAIRRQVPAPAAETNTPPMRLSVTRQPALMEDCLYSRNHFWTVAVAPGLLRVGIEPGFVRAIGNPKAIVLPSRGQTLYSGQTCAWVVMNGGTLSLEAPVGGSVGVTNILLTQSPHLLKESPFDKGWLYEIAVDEEKLAAADLVSPNRIAGVYAADENRFLASLSGMLHNDQPDVGLTLADGGQRLESISYLVGPARYFNAVRRVYG